MPRQRKLPTGMCIRNGSYHAQFRSHGQLVRKKLSGDFDTAKQMMNDLRARADKSDFGIRDNDLPWNDLKVKFLRWAKQAVRRPKEYEADLKRIESYQRVTSVRHITPQYVLGYREWRLAQTVRGTDRFVTPRTVNRDVNTLRNMLNKGKYWKMLGGNPIADIEPLPHDSPVKERRPLTVDEVTDLFEASPDYLKAVWRMFMTSGIRRGELVDLRFSDIDYDRQTATVRAVTAKSHKARDIPLDRTVLAMIRDLHDRARRRQPVKGVTRKQTQQQSKSFSRSHVFVSQANTPLRNNLLRRFYAICKRAGIEGAEPGGSVDIHSLRVSFVTLSLEHGANPKAVQRILGHSTLALTMNVYAKATERGKREAIGVLPYADMDAPDHVISIENGCRETA
jgi:integrase